MPGPQRPARFQDFYPFGRLQIVLQGFQKGRIAHFPADKFTALAFVAYDQLVIFALQIFAAQANHLIHGAGR